MSNEDEDMENFRFLAENSLDILCRVDQARVMQYVSPASERVLGWRPEEMLGKTSDAFVLAEDLPVLEAATHYEMLPETENAATRLRMRRKDGSIAWVETNARPVGDSEGIPRGYVLVMRDVTLQQRREEELAALALTDQLTGLANRRAFDEALEREWIRTLREGARLSLLLLDVDLFKSLNDRYGHKTGDDCLRAVATAVRSAVRASDFVARYGGEEIAVILPGADAAGAIRVAELVRAAVQGLRLPHAGNTKHGALLTASVGAATVVAWDGERIGVSESLLLAADNALYKAKHEGRNRVATSALVAQEGRQSASACLPTWLKDYAQPVEDAKLGPADVAGQGEAKTAAR